MSNERVCPYRKTITHYLGYDSEDFLPCLYEACMAWDRLDRACLLIDPRKPYIARKETD